MSNADAESMPALVVEAPPSVPFEDTENPSKDFEVTKPIDVGLLQREIAETLGHDVSVVVAFSGEPKPDAVSKKHPAKVYVSAEKDFDGRKIRGVISSHEPAVDEVPDLLESLRSGEDLDLAGVNIVLRYLAGGR